jgi:hypothetical protein
MAPKRAVYTALIGGYEDLIEQPTALASDVDFICFTDDPNATSTSWQLRLIKPILPLDMVRSQRDLKIRGHESLSIYDELLYIDNAVVLRQDPSDILERWLADGDFALTPHSFREQVFDEFEEVAALKYDDPGRISEQLQHYAELYPDVLSQRPFWNGMFARRNKPEVARMMNIWFDHVLRFSRRDQLSANVAFSLGDVRIVVIDENNNESPSHQWPAGVNRKASLTVSNGRRTAPLVAELRAAHRQADAANRLLADREDLLNHIAAESRAKDVQLAELGAQLEAAKKPGAAAVVLVGERPVRLMVRIRRLFQRKRLSVDKSGNSE